MPQGDVHAVVGDGVKLPVHGAPGAPGLIGPGLSPAGPELSGGVFFGEVQQFGIGWQIGDRHQVQLRAQGKHKHN